MDLDGVVRRLERAEFRECRPVWHSSNYVFLARLEDAAGEFLAIYKPRDGETPLWDFPQGTLHLRETAAYVLSTVMGWQLIPPTVVREGPAGVGSLQLFIDHEPAKHYFVLREDRRLWPQLQRLCLFDAIANNADRKAGHCLLDAEEHVWGIDNGLCFHPQPKLRSVIWDWAGEPIPPTMLRELRRTVGRLKEGAAGVESLRRLLEPAEFAALVRRAASLAEGGRFPVPGEARHYPWPLV